MSDVSNASGVFVKFSIVGLLNVEFEGNSTIVTASFFHAFQNKQRSRIMLVTEDSIGMVVGLPSAKSLLLQRISAVLSGWKPEVTILQMCWSVFFVTSGKQFFCLRNTEQ